MQLHTIDLRPFGSVRSKFLEIGYIAPDLFKLNFEFHKKVQNIVGSQSLTGKFLGRGIPVILCLQANHTGGYHVDRGSAQAACAAQKRYPSDLTDMEWSFIEPMIPPAQRGGRPRETDMREVMNAARYVLRTGCQWRQVAEGFPAAFDGLQLFLGMVAIRRTRRIHHTLLVACLKPRAARLRPRPRSSTPRPSRPPKKGAHSL